MAARAVGVAWNAPTGHPLSPSVVVRASERRATVRWTHERCFHAFDEFVCVEGLVVDVRPELDQNLGQLVDDVLEICELSSQGDDPTLGPFVVTFVTALFVGPLTTTPAAVLPRASDTAVRHEPAPAVRTVGLDRRTPLLAHPTTITSQ